MGASLGQPRYICSHRGVAILAPIAKPAVASLAVNTVPDGLAIHGDHRAASSISGSLQGLAAQLALRGKGNLTGGQIEQPLGTVAAHDGGFLDGALGKGNSDDGGNAGAGQTVRAGHGLRGLWGLLSPPCSYYRGSGEPGYGSEPIL